MKSIILLIGIVLFYNCSARKKDSKGDNPSESIEGIILEPNLFHEKLNVDSLLNSYNDEILQLKENEFIYPLDSIIDSDSSRVIVIGKFINKSDVFALDIYGNWQTQNIYFYKYDDKWKRIESDDYNWDVLSFNFQNFNFDEDNEILIKGHYNMNGNQQNTIYKFDTKTNKFIKSCSLFATELSYDNNKNLVYYQYFGSWYMENIQTIYKWKNNKLIPEKSVVKQYKNTSELNNGKEWIQYYENPTQDKDTLVLKFKKTYKEKNKKLYDLWENFFEQ
ncbi:MAG: hypothetical protein RSE15_09705 [Flavobacterium sp.]|jgi:hypothetical protein|uniref:hypothetical protein n=1 Tax=Flavobacterium sp. TaxID=239 RepID=UPI002B48292E|nr:hypothetical protein [Flavobacterium sp.]WRH72636.1 MAG: hypothetical protein RSE15_09705 [Flavobacterium sp.]